MPGPLLEACPHLWYDPHQIIGSGGETCGGGTKPTNARLIEELHRRGLVLNNGDGTGTIQLPEATNETNQQSLDADRLEGTQPDQARIPAPTKEET